MKRKTQLFLLLSLLWAAGCQKEASHQSNEGSREEREAMVQIHASLSKPTNATKAIIQGTTIPDNFSYGIFVCMSNDETYKKKHKDNSWNLKASYKANEEEEGTWSYQYVNPADGSLNENSYNNITITAREGHEHADLYAYAPYTAYTADDYKQSGPTAIPFSIANNNKDQLDLMYAVENTSPTENKDLDPESETDFLEANFTFKHALVLLAFEFEIKNYNNLFSTKYLLNNIVIKNKKPENYKAHLYKSGSFNAITGEFYNCTEVDALSVNVSNADGSSMYIYPVEGKPDATAYFALVPTQVEDNELEIEITLNNHKTKPFVIKKENLRHNGEGDEFGFQGGYKYTFSFTMDNYLYLTDFTITEWDDQVYPLETVEI
jgi:hypothetical protein